MTDPRATSESVLALFDSQGHSFSARNLATAAHRAAKFRRGSHDLRRDKRMTALADAARSRLSEFSAQALANTAWAFATARVDARDLFDAIADSARSRLGEFNSQELANTAWAFATAGVEARDLFNAVADAAQSRLAEFNAQDLANTAWAFACVDSKDVHLFPALMYAAAATSSLSNSELSQFYAVSLHCRLEWPTLDFPEVESQQMLQEAYQSGEASPSRLQRDVAAALDRIGWAHVFEHVTAEGLSLDMAQPGERRAVEVDGPSHYLKNAEGRCVAENGATRFKARLLQRLGWDVIHVPFFEWPQDSAAQDVYLRSKLVR